MASLIILFCTAVLRWSTTDSAISHHHPCAGFVDHPDKKDNAVAGLTLLEDTATVIDHSKIIVFKLSGLML